MMKVNQSTVLKVSAVAIAIPRYAGAFALSAGFVAEGQLHGWLGIAEVVAGIAMALLEGFALSYILSKWRLLKPGSLPWYASLAVSLLLALSLPLVAVPYPYFMQANLSTANDLFSSKIWQYGWDFIVAFAPMLIVIGVGLSDVDELAREANQADIELALSKKRAMLELELSKIELEVEQAKAKTELEIKQLRANYKLATSNVEAKAKQSQALAFACEHCSEQFSSKRALAGHLAHCKEKLTKPEIKLLEASTNGKINESEVSHG
jgi:hypothetical protein